jgi:hypothetical protein
MKLEITITIERIKNNGKVIWQRYKMRNLKVLKYFLFKKIYNQINEKLYLKFS